MRQIDFHENPHDVLPDILNFRDIGGIISDEENSCVRHGLVFRSGRLSDLVENDLRLLGELGVTSIFDLRARREREADPTIWQGGGVETHVFRPGHKRRLVDMAQDYPATPAGAEALMRDFSAELPRTMAHVFGELLVRISQGAFPCIIHCSAGKDRTGMAVALLLAALGCGREAIVADYVASAHARRIEGAMVRSVVRDGLHPVGAGCDRPRLGRDGALSGQHRRHRAGGRAAAGGLAGKHGRAETMKALLSQAAGGPETLVLADRPVPAAGPGELLVKILVCAINYPDVLIIEDKYQFKPERPFAPGSEICAEVAAVGEDVEGWAPGDRLIAVTGHGGLSEYMLLPAAKAFALPHGRDPMEGAALLMTYATTIHALVDRGALAAGETLLVLGAAGGVGLAAVEIGKAMGARVVAAAPPPR